MFWVFFLHCHELYEFSFLLYNMHIRFFFSKFSANFPNILFSHIVRKIPYEEKKYSALLNIIIFFFSTIHFLHKHWVLIHGHVTFCTFIRSKLWFMLLEITPPWYKKAAYVIITSFCTHAKKYLLYCNYSCGFQQKFVLQCRQKFF